MNTKLNVNAIEPGSIPLSALASEVKDKIENAGGADWNAKEGEAGYIENRTHYVTGTAETINVNGEWSITKTNIIVNDDSIIDISWNIDFMANHTEGSCRFTGTDESNTYYFDNDGFKIDFQNHGGLIDLDMWAFGGADPHYGTVTIGVDLKYKTLDEVYIPDTVIKTTPQTLTNADKNQALTNLGIDPVIWKYMCNPFIVKQGHKFPDELLAEGVNLDMKYHIPAMYRIFIEDETKVNSNASKGSTITPAYVGYTTMEGPIYSSSGEFVEASWYIDGSIDIHYSV